MADVPLDVLREHIRRDVDTQFPAPRLLFARARALDIKVFSEDQPRDDSGRWTSTGSSAAPNPTGKYERAETVAAMSEEDFRARPPRGFRYDPSMSHEGEHGHGGGTDITLGPGFFRMTPAQRVTVINHEIGHGLSDEMLSDGSAFELADKGAMGPRWGIEREIPARMAGRGFDGRLVAGPNGTDTPGEAIAETYSILHDEPTFLRDKFPELGRAVLDAARAHGYPVPASAERVIKMADNQPRDEDGRWTSGGGAFPSSREALDAQSIQWNGGSWGHRQTRDGKPITPETPLVVYHATTREVAELLTTQGFDPAEKPTNLARMRYEAGEEAEYAPGRGVSNGLYVAGIPEDASGYGPVTLAVHVRAGDLAVTPEQAALGSESVPADPIEGLRVGDAQITRKIAPEDIRIVNDDRRLSTTYDMVAQALSTATKVFDPDQQRDASGRWASGGGGATAVAGPDIDSAIEKAGGRLIHPSEVVGERGYLTPSGKLWQLEASHPAVAANVYGQLGQEPNRELGMAESLGSDFGTVRWWGRVNEINVESHNDLSGPQWNALEDILMYAYHGRSPRIEWDGYKPDSVRHYSVSAGTLVEARDKLAAHGLVQKMAEGQPRDERGQWTSGGGSATAEQPPAADLGVALGKLGYPRVSTADLLQEASENARGGLGSGYLLTPKGDIHDIKRAEHEGVKGRLKKLGVTDAENQGMVEILANRRETNFRFSGRPSYDQLGTIEDIHTLAPERGVFYTIEPPHGSQPNGRGYAHGSGFERLAAALSEHYGVSLDTSKMRRPFEEEDKAFNPSQARDALGKWTSGLFGDGAGDGGTSGSEAASRLDVRPTSAYRDKAELAQRRSLLDVSRRFGVVPDQIITTANQHLKDFMEGAQVKLNLPEEVMAQVFSSGQIMNQFQSGTSTALLDADMRMQVEHAAFNAPNEANEFERDDPRSAEAQHPKYGWMYSPKAGPMDEAEDYGGVEITLKPDVMARTTITVGDSLRSLDQARTLPSPALAPDWKSVVDSSMLMDLYSARDPTQMQFSAGYVEAQVHGPLTLDNVASIHLSPEVVNANEIRVAAGKAGIPIT